MPRASTSLLLGPVAALLCAGTCADTDIGYPCAIPLSAPDLANPECRADSDPAKQPECFRPDLSARDKDFIAFGATECDNLVCVRSACALPSDTPDRDARCAKELPAGNPAGICSAECIQDADCKAGEGLEGRFGCRTLVLDQDFLEDLRENLSDEEYQRYFGRIQSAKFCARLP